MTSTDDSNATTTTDAIAAVEDHDRWLELADESYRRLAAAFAAVPAERWADSTPCAGWTVRDLGGHLVGAMRSAASLRELASQQRAVARRTKQTGEAEVDAMTAIQIERAAALTPAEVVTELEDLRRPAVRGRGRIPGPIRRTAKIHVQMGTIDERWTLEYFNDCILTRDAWLHAVDLADALGEPMPVDAHDAAIIGDVAVEWASRHGGPVDLTLTGPAGGHLCSGTGDREPLEIDAVEFCRVVSGRASHPHPLLATAVPF